MTEKCFVGSVHKNNKGEEFEIIEKLEGNKRKVKFNSNNFEKTTTNVSILDGSVKNGDIRKFEVGSVFKNKKGCSFEIFEKVDERLRRVKFLDSFGYETIADISNIKAKSILNPYFKQICGVGYFGVGDYKATYGLIRDRKHQAWVDMLKRCYDKKCQEKQPTYKGVTVCKEWLNFQNFAEWYNENHPKICNIRFEIDKDLLQKYETNKIYSPNTCVFLPKHVNSFIAVRSSTGTSEYIGVNYHKSTKKWVAQIMAFGEGKKKHLGLFPTPEEASFAYQSARSEQAEKVKDYLRSLNYLPEHIIELIK